jgi:DNA-binding response OmpR family regulator
MKLLLVEDNQELAKNIITYLKTEGNICEHASTFHDAIDKVVIYDYDVIMLDIMLPDGTGLNVLRELREHQSDVGVLIISARNSLEDKIEGLDLGADDYITKPFDLSELNARIKAIYRRKNFNGNKEISFNEIKINIDSTDVYIKEDPINLTQKEYELLIYFLSNKNRVITKQSIAEHLWGDQADMFDSFDFVYQHIKNLRKKMIQAGSRDYLDTVYGLGYKFNTKKS